MKFAIIGAVAATVTALTTPALAQPVISDPGRCAQYYPNANCQNYGPGNPYTDGGYYRDGGWQNSQAMMPRHVNPSAPIARHHHHHWAHGTRRT